jgi:hypothetical protein
MRKTLLKALPMLFVALLIAIQSINAQTYYVDVSNGSDSNNGSSQANAFKTIQAAVNAASGTSIINIAAGTYPENVIINKSNITLIGAGSGANGNNAPTAPSAGTHTIISGGAAGRGIQVSGAQTNLTVRDLAITGYSHDGFYAPANSNNLSLINLQINSNCTVDGRGGIFISGGINNVLIQGCAVQNNGPGATARGIAIWDNLKSNVSIKNNYVIFTSCCGIDLNDGTSSGVNISNNTLIAGSASSDSAIGVLGMMAGNGANIISNNSITVAKRYGIEIKNPAGSGIDDELADGAIIVKNNAITRTDAGAAVIGAEARDIAGIAVFRRSFTSGNPSSYIDVPSGVVIKDNTISGFQQLGANGEGYGIVVEGVRMTVKNNTVSNCDIGIQRQSGNSSNYVKNNSGDADQVAAGSTYFNRGNAPFSASIVLSGNTLTTGNGVQTRDEFAGGTYLGDNQFVFNATKKNNYATINLAVEYAAAGNTLELSPNTFDELVVVDKSLTIDGVDKSNRTIKYTGATISSGSVTPAIFKVSAPNVTIKNVTMEVDLAKIWSAVISNGDVAGLSIVNNNIKAVRSATTNAASYTDRNAVGINISGRSIPGVTNASNPSGLITFQGNTVTYTNDPTPANVAAFRAAVAVDNYNVLVENNTTIAVNHDVTNRFQTTSGQSILRNNVFNGGGIEFSEPNAPYSGTVVENNDFNYLLGGLPAFALVRFKNNNANKPVVFNNNQVRNHYWLMSLENFQNINVEGNTFTPIKDANDYFQIITINTKTISSSANTKLPIAASIVGNTFNGVAGSVGSKAIAFYNHDNATPQFGTFTIGAVGKLNVFNNDISQYLYIDNNNGNATRAGSVALTGYPEYGGSISITNTGYWTTDIRADQNSFYVDGQLRTVASLTQAQRNLLDALIFDKLDDNNVGKVNYYFPIRNITTTENFATLQDAINDADTQNGDVINVENGTYTLTDAVTINKEVTIRGNGGAPATKPVINGVGNATNKALFEVDAANVKVQNFEFQIAQTGNAMIGVGTTATDNFNNLEVSDNIFRGMKTFATGLAFDSYALKLGRLASGPALPKNQINVVRNEVTYNSLTPDLFGRAFYAYNVYGKIGGATLDANTVAAFYVLQAGQIGSGVSGLEFSYNNVLGGLVSVVGADAGAHKIANNVIGAGITQLSQANSLAAYLEVRGTRNPSATVEVSGNTIQNYSNIGAFIQRSDNVTLSGNTFTPFQNAANTNFASIVFSSKEGTSGAQSAVESKNLTITANTFNGSGVNGGTAILFYNHNASPSIKALTNAKIGGSDADKNTFNASLTNYISLDATVSGTSVGLTALYGAQDGTNTTNILPFDADIDASYNVFGAVNTGTSTNFDDLVAVKGKISDGVDNGLTGYVNIQPQKAFIGLAADKGNAFSKVPDNFNIVLQNDDAVYFNMGNRTITKAFTFSIDNNTTDEIIFGDLILNALAKEVTFANKVKVNESFTVTEGKLTASQGLTLNGAKAISFNLTKPANYVNGKITLLNASTSGATNLILGNASASAMVGIAELTATSDFDFQYFPASYSNTTSFNNAVLGYISNKEYWTINRIAGTGSAKVNLGTYDFATSGFNSFASADAKIARFDTGTTSWVDAGNTSNSVNANVGTMLSGANANFGVFTFAKTPLNVLPVNLISFKAQATNNGALVKWTTAEEKDVAKFEVEKSFNGKDYFVIDTRAGQNNFAAVVNYEFLDKNFSQSAYYRLAQTDKNGDRKVFTQYTEFVKGLSNLSVVAYPNPVTNKLFVSVGSDNKETVKVLLTDLTGKTLKAKTADNTQPIELDVAGVASGSYILQVVKDSGNVTKKIVKL